MKSFSGSCETDAYVFLISLFRTSTSISTSTAITPPQLGSFTGHGASHRHCSPYLLGDRGGSERSPRLPRGHGNEQAAGAGEHGDDQDRRLRRSEVGADPGDQGAEDEAEVAPEAVHADHACPIARLACVRDGGDQSRIDHRRAGAKPKRRSERGPEGTIAG